jgi:hypothetical protein
MNDNKPDYTLKVKGIRHILLQEYYEKKNRLLNLCSLGDKSIYEYFSNELYAMQEKIALLETYEDCDYFISEHYRMSLEDWINSL